MRRLAFFWDDEMKHVVVEGLRRLQQKHAICLMGYVVMPEHVHVVLLPHAPGEAQPIPISVLFNDFKRHTGFYGKQRLRDVWRSQGKLWSDPLNQWAHGEFGEQSLWTTRAYDFNIQEHATLITKLEYCHKNPVTRGLVDHPADWPWSSYRFYELHDRSMLAMDWDCRWPVVW
jgi:putative transposase